LFGKVTEYYTAINDFMAGYGFHDKVHSLLMPVKLAASFPLPECVFRLVAQQIAHNLTEVGHYEP
jgi:hypothetical protein